MTLQNHYLRYMKAIIPVAGAGKRLRPHTYTQPKPLILVAGKPIISFIIDEVLKVGITDFVFIIGYLGEKIRLFLEETYPHLHMEFVYQEERQGLGHAIWTARDSLKGSSEIFIILGDTIFEANLTEMISHPLSCLGVKKVSDPRDFGVVETDEKGFARRVIEKPNIPKSNLAIVGLYKIKEVNALLEALSYNMEHNIRTMGEFQLADALQRMIDTGIRINTLPVNNWFDCGKKDILLETNRMLLDREGFATDDLPEFEDTIIVHPVSIGKGCQISHSIIGPHVTIGENTQIRYSIIKDSIIGHYAAIEEVVLHNSVVGSDTAVKGSQQSLNIGDNTEIDLS